MAIKPEAISLRVVKEAGEELGNIAREELRLRANRVIRAINRAADTIPEYIAQEVFGSTDKPSGPGWQEVAWRPLSPFWMIKKPKDRENMFFYNTSDLRMAFLSGGFKVGRAFGRAYVLVNGVRPKSLTDWSNIQIDMDDPNAISMDFYPFLRAGNALKPRNRDFAFQSVQRGLNRESALKLMSTKKVYRPVIEPTLIYFAQKHLRALANREVMKQELI